MYAKSVTNTMKSLAWIIGYVRQNKQLEEHARFSSFHRVCYDALPISSSNILVIDGFS